MITLFEKFRFYKKGLHITYSAIMLDNKSKELLLSTFIYPDQEFSEWTKHGDHMTICIGELPEHLKRYWLDEKITLTATELGISDKAVAVKVEGFFNLSKNSDVTPEELKVPHITLAINPFEGKPVDSNYITNWKPIEPLTLNGVVREIEL
jgi:hypothetical protein